MFDELEAASLDQRRDATEERLKRVLRVAGSTTSYGRSTGGGTSLRDWPLLEKETIRDDPAAFLGRGHPLVSKADTSGTTGTPLSLLRSPTSIAVEQATIDRLVWTKRIDLRTARVAVLRGDDIALPGAESVAWRDDASGRRRVFQSNDLSERTVAAVADAVSDFSPDCLFAYPTVLESFCTLLERAGRQLRVPLTLTSSEVLSAASRRIATQVLSTEVVDYYGQAERVNFAYSLVEDVYVFLPGYSATELVRVGGDDESDVFEIVGTSLWNLAMPLIRYRTGDLVTVPKKSSQDALERICFGLDPISGIAGRTDDYLIAPDGGRLVGIDHIPRGVKNVLRLQIVQERRDSVRILVLAKAGFGDDDRAQLTVNARRKLPESVALSIEVVESLEQRSQKTPLVIRRQGV
ncbi:MAG: hypothetical protein ABI990_00090 [Actinomycetota bacterium]